MNWSIIQGGMGVYVSTPFLARACATFGDGQVLGTVSGVTAGSILARILQTGDEGGHYRRALNQFPFPCATERILKRYFVEGGIPVGQKFKTVPVFNMRSGHDLVELTVAANFAFVWLAKEGHTRPVSINWLEKIQIPHIYEIFGAMLAGVDYVTMGAGLTLQIPALLDAIANGENPSYRVSVEGSEEGTKTISFDPRKFFDSDFPKMKRPGFLPVVSTDFLATLMTKKLPQGSVQGFVIELPTAGGHNAPPRDKKTPLSEKGEPVYGPKDEVAFEKLRSLDIPFWIGGSFATPEGLAKAKTLGARGIQAGSIFALSENSGMQSIFRKEIRRLGFRGELVIRTDPRASPTGFPFKVVQLPQTLSSPEVCDARERNCNLCLLRVPYERPDGAIGFRCPAEPADDYVGKGGEQEDTVGRLCICNGLMSSVGIGDPDEPAIITLGDDTSFLPHLMFDENASYSVEDAITYLLR